MSAKQLVEPAYIAVAKADARFCAKLVGVDLEAVATTTTAKDYEDLPFDDGLFEYGDKPLKLVKIKTKVVKDGKPHDLEARAMVIEDEQGVWQTLKLVIVAESLIPLMTRQFDLSKGIFGEGFPLREEIDYVDLFCKGKLNLMINKLFPEELSADWIFDIPTLMHDFKIADEGETVYVEYDLAERSPEVEKVQFIIDKKRDRLGLRILNTVQIVRMGGSLVRLLRKHDENRSWYVQKI